MTGDDDNDAVANALIEEIAAENGLSEFPNENDLRGRLGTALSEVAQLENAKPEGGVKVVVRGRSISLNETSWALLKATCGLALLGLAGPLAAPATGAILLETVYSCRNVIRKLDATEQSICAAVAEQRRQKKLRKEAELRVTEAEITSYFHSREEDVPVDLDKVLDELVGDKDVLNREREKNVAFYSIKF